MTVSLPKVNLLSALLLLLFLAANSLTVDFEEHQHYLSNLVQLQKSSITFDREVIKARYEAFSSYDPLLKSLQEQKKAETRLQDIPPFISRHGKEEIRKILAKQQATIAQCEELLEIFKSQNATLKNSLLAIPHLYLERPEAGERAFPSTLSTFHSVLHQIFLYHLTANEEFAPLIAAQVKKLSQLAQHYPASKTLNSINLAIAHASNILEKKPTVDDVTQKLTAFENSRFLEALQDTYDNYYQQAIHTASLYRLFTYGWLLILLGWGAYSMINRLTRVHSRTENILASITDAFIGLDHQWNIIYLNPPASEMLACQPKQLLQKNFWQVFPKQLGKQFYGYYQKAVTEQTVVSFEWSLDSQYFEVRAYPSTEGLSIVYHDITERKQAEIALQETNQRLQRQSQALLKLNKQKPLLRGNLQAAVHLFTQIAAQTLEVERASIWLYDEERQRLRCLNLYEHSLNAHKSGMTLSASDCPTYFHVLQNERIVVDSNVRRSGTQPKSGFCCPASIKARLDAPIRRDGKIVGIICNEHVGSVRQWTLEEENFAGSLADFVSLAMEEIERLQAQSDLQQANKHLEQRVAERTAQLVASTQAAETARLKAETANQTKSEFLARMSHELRTPLNAILGFTQLLMRESLNSSQQEQLRIINRSGEHLLKLINDVLEMSKIEAGRVTLNCSSFDFHRLLDSLEDMLKLKAEAKRLQLIFDCSSQVPRYIHSDEGKLRQVLINLLSNAIKFTATGGVTLRVGVGTSDDADEIGIIFEVEDTGPGIAAEELNDLFKAFVQTASGRQSQQGTGLGLSISQKFIQLMGGEMTVNSTLGQGSVFRFSVQVGLAHAADSLEEQHRRRPIRLTANQPKYRLLVVEDRWENRKLLVKLLTSLGFEVRQAKNGQEGIALWETWNPHLILMDMRMPVMNGYEAAQYIKAHPQGQGTTILALTASAFEEERTAILAAGCDDFIRKPFREEMLLNCIAEHLQVCYDYEAELPDEPPPINILTPEALQKMSAEWLAQLRNAATQVDADLVSTLIQEIPEDNAQLTCGLNALVSQFRFDQIVSLTHPSS